MHEVPPIDTLDNQSGWKQMITFPDQSASFAHGFEAGTVWHELKTDMFPRGKTVRAENIELMKAMAAHFN